jgi:hypothetical protein
MSGKTYSTETVVNSYAATRVVAGPNVPTTRIATTVQEVELPPSFRYGSPTSGTWQRLGDQSEVMVGDIVRLTYRMQIPWFQTWQTDFIVWKLNRDSRFSLRHVAVNEEKRQVVVEVEVLKPLSPALLVPVIIITALAGGLIFLTTVSIERLGTLQVGDTKIKLGPLLVMGGLVLGGLYLWRRV